MMEPCPEGYRPMIELAGKNVMSKIPSTGLRLLPPLDLYDAAKQPNESIVIKIKIKFT